ncbi:membrane-associated protein [Methanolinea mesophila]|uniref:DedA family protein n=1 Tax=Methanolinea mesophila TaxID=547055 RepID=UPI001AE301F9|nr:VTT domain-containing protein [Methanolinea mesophila]MBP1929624.1 membrane-associated protein [Methanolinea mesophila]
MPADPLNLILNFDSTFPAYIHEYGIWIYLLIFVVIFIECGVVFLPLTGNPILFVGGIAASDGSLNPFLLIMVGVLAAYSGYVVSYWSGNYFGLKFLQERYPGLFDKEHVEKTTVFFERYGSETIIISHYIPMVRKFAPFIAGIWRMDQHKFAVYNLLGALLWTVPLVLIGFFLGKLPFFQAILPFLVIIVVAIIIVSIVATIAMMRPRKNKTE